MKVTNAVGHNILWISDTHFPYQHKDTFDFLGEVKKKYKITMARHVGDINDNHYPTYHELEPGSYDGETELKLARAACKTLEHMFPELVIAEGNHDALPLRKAKTARIPEGHIRDYNSVYGVGKGWRWVKYEFLRVAPESTVLLTHSVGANVRTNAGRFAHSSVQGHHHSEYGVVYYADNASLRWSMSVGTLADPSSPTQNYMSRQVLRRPILGVGVTEQGRPVLVPMVLKSNGRWNGKL